MSSQSHYFRARRAKLFERQHGLCFWCAKHVIGAGTLDHLRSRTDPLRGFDPIEEGKGYVLSCAPCNLRRGLVEDAHVRKHGKMTLTESLGAAAYYSDAIDRFASRPGPVAFWHHLSAETRAKWVLSVPADVKLKPQTTLLPQHKQHVRDWRAHMMANGSSKDRIAPFRGDCA